MEIIGLAIMLVRKKKQSTETSKLRSGQNDSQKNIKSCSTRCRTWFDASRFDYCHARTKALAKSVP